MKRTLLTLALVAVAGAAGAQAVGTTAGGATGVSGTSPAGSPLTYTNPPASAGAAITASTPINTAKDTTGSTDASVNVNLANAPPPQRPTGAAGTAQRRIEQDGYKNVQNLQLGADGLWHGTAMRGNTAVQVTVDRSGRVAAQ
jgi:hypothetical protein